jgi:large conductance mechanosensitive channel
MLQDFKKFAMRGNVIDMAVGVIIGAAFGKIVASLVNDVLMPPLGLLIGNMDFSDLSLTLRGATETAKPVVISYGLFINNVINFVIVAFSIFLMIRFISRFQKKEEAAPAAPTDKKCPQCALMVPLEAKRCGHCTSNI